MITPIFYAKALDGKLQFERQAEFKHYLKSLKGDVQVTISKRKKIRSIAENSYYWGVVIKIVSDEMGLLPDETHEFLKSLFLKMGMEVKGKRYEVTRSTTLLSTIEFEDYLAKCRAWTSMELNTYIPEPNEVEYEGKELTVKD